MIDHPTYDDTIRRPWHVPGAHESREMGDDAGAELLFGPRIDTEPADLDDTKRSADGLGFVLAGSTLAGVILGAALAHWWPALLAFGGW